MLRIAIIIILIICAIPCTQTFTSFPTIGSADYWPIGLLLPVNEQPFPPIPGFQPYPTNDSTHNELKPLNLGGK